jgi:hypothetical protein
MRHWFQFCFNLAFEFNLRRFNWGVASITNGLMQGAKLSKSMNYDWRKVEETLNTAAAAGAYIRSQFSST